MAGQGGGGGGGGPALGGGPGGWGPWASSWCSMTLNRPPVSPVTALRVTVLVPRTSCRPSPGPRKTTFAMSCSLGATQWRQSRRSVRPAVSAALPGPDHLDLSAVAAFQQLEQLPGNSPLQAPPDVPSALAFRSTPGGVGAGGWVVA